MKDKLAVQLYTLREECKNNFPQVLSDLKRMGWAAVQMAGYYDLEPEEAAAHVRQAKLQTAGLHVSYNRITDEWDALIKEAGMFGTKDLVCSSLPSAFRTAQGVRRVRKALNEAAARLHDHGLRLSYHNHDYEFEILVEGQNALDYLLDPSADNRILSETDVYWVKKTGRDPARFIHRYSNRMPLIHLKDMAVDREPGFAEIGTGIIDFRPILQWGERHGVEWYIVEQDECYRDPMACVETSYNNLMELISNLQSR